MHALDLESLRQPDITLWTIWDAGVLAGCGALKALDPQHAGHHIDAHRRVPPGIVKLLRESPVNG
jgi:hypothetical protein